MSKADMQAILFCSLQYGPPQVIADWSLLDREIPLTRVFHLFPVA